MMEALPIFLGLAMLALINGDSTKGVAHGATVFLVARAAYVPSYTAGISGLRSIVWLVGMAGLLMMALPQSR